MPKKETPDLNRLATAIRYSRQALRRFRAERREAVRQYVGKHWSDDGSEKEIPVNLLSLFVSIVGRNLIPKAPRVLLSTFDHRMKPIVSDMQRWANDEIERMGLANTLQRAVVDALFSLGIIKVALASPADEALVPDQRPKGMPFAERVDLDDFVYDIHARDFSEVTFIGHRFRAPLEVIRESKEYGKARKALTPSYDNPYNLEGDERVSSLNRGLLQGNSEEFKDFIDLWEVYLPGESVVLTLQDDQITGASVNGNGLLGEPLREQEWVGPYCGPYHLLPFGIVPGNAMPKAPIQDLIPLHLMTNLLYRKIGNQAERQKELTLTRSGSVEEQERINAASDGEAVKCELPEAVQTRLFGGVNPQTMATAVHFHELFKEMGGNLDMMGGLSPQSKTLGQDQMLAQNASRAVVDLQERTTEYVAHVIGGLCWYWWNHPSKKYESEHKLSGPLGLSQARQVTPQMRKAIDYEDLSLRVDPYSLQHQTPQARLQALNGVVSQIMPILPLMMQQGITLDLNAYMRKVAQYADMPDLTEILTVMEPPQDMAPSGGEVGSAKPTNTNRTYTRQSLAGESSQAKKASVLNMMSGGSEKNAQTNGTVGAVR